MRFENVEKAARKLLEHVHGFYENVPDGYTLSEDSFARAVNVIGRFSSVDKYTLFQSAHGFIGMPVNENTFYELCYAVAANKADLREKKVVPFRSKLMTDGVYTVRFLSVRYTSKDTLSIKAMALTGCLAHRIVLLHPSLTKAYGWMRALGYTGKVGDPCVYAPMTAAFPGLLGNMEIITPHNQPAPPNMVKIEIVSNTPRTKYGVGTDVIAKHNQKIIKKRSGYDDCPCGHEDERARIRNFCALFCPEGWEKCDACGHEEPYEMKICSVCETAFSHAPNADRCRKCQREQEGLYDFD